MKENIYIYPTDTVWGIGGNIYSPGMAQKVNSIKGYDDLKPLSILFYNIDMLADYFQLELLDKEWLEILFSMEATLGLPVSWMKKKIPEEAYAGSSFICVRVLTSPSIKELISEAGGPVFTTSFNKKEQAPLTTQSQAEALQKELCPDAIILNSEASLSGSSSTIAVLDEDIKFEILRPGTRVGEIEKHIKLLTA